MTSSAAIQVAPGHALSGKVQEALARMPVALQGSCGVGAIYFKDMGPSAEFNPNHGYYTSNYVVLNDQMATSEVTYRDQDKVVPEFEFILMHELGHGFDEIRGDLSLDEKWLNLSGWVQHPEKGTSRITIRDAGAVVEGEWSFRDGSRFCRYYGMRNPWDDFADCFAFYVLGMRGFLSPEKLEYMERALQGLL